MRLAVDLSPNHRQRFRAACRDAKEEPLANVIDRVATVLGAGPHPDFNRFMEAVAADASAHGVKLTAKRKNLLQMALASREEAAAPVIKKVHKSGVEVDPLCGLFPTTIGRNPAVVLSRRPGRAGRCGDQIGWSLRRGRSIARTKRPGTPVRRWTGRSAAVGDPDTGPAVDPGLDAI